jgi:hypothetical protein
MSFSTDYPEYSEIEELIRRARAERSVIIAHMIADAVVAVIRGFKQMRAGLAHGIKLERDIHALQVDALFRRSLPHH